MTIMKWIIFTRKKDNPKISGLSFLFYNFFSYKKFFSIEVKFFLKILLGLFDKIYSYGYNELRLIAMMKINVSEIAEQIGHEKAFSFDAKPEDIGPLLDDCKLEGPIMVKR